MRANGTIEQSDGARAELSGPIRVALVDDHNVLRAGLRVLLERQPDMVVVAEAATGEEAAAMVERERPDVVLMDISLPGIDGVEATKRLTRLAASTRVIALTMHESQRFVRQMLEAGATGYVTKRAADSELVNAIRAVYRGELFVHSSVARAVVDGYLGREASPVLEEHNPLSRRETEVLKLLALGHTNQEVADQLFLSVKTIETHKARLVEKLKLRTRADLVRYALDRGFLQDA